MRVRGVLILTGIVSSILGALVVYLVLSVPNDLRADISRLLAATSWRPRTSLRDGIERTVGALA